MHLLHGNVTNKVWETGDCVNSVFCQIFMFPMQCVPRVVCGLHPHVCLVFFLHLTWNINLKTCWGNDVLILPLTMAWRYLQFWGSCLSFFSDSSNFRQCSNVHARRHKCSRWSLQNNQCNCYLISNFSIGLYISLRSYLLEQNLSLF